ncbi:MAG: hypothetical protein K6E36_06520 [Oscillospiraceae bacterium]|nr:hypothetical protein [Oscillospiraceae bacterium]
MWNQTVERALMELREDAVLLFDAQSLELLYLNSTAKELFGEAVGKSSSDLIQSSVIEGLIHTTLETGKLCACSPDDVHWFPERAVVHTVAAAWEGKPAVAVTIDKRAYGAPPEALQMMKAVLSASYFMTMRIDLQTGKASAMISRRPLLSTQPTFSSFSEFIRIYAEASIHPEDREQFLSCFSTEQLHLFTQADTAPVCTVRRLLDEEYRWASFSLTAVNPQIILLLGKDSNEIHLQKEESARYQSELKTVSHRNELILSSVNDIFRLMLHVDLRNGNTTICSMSPDFASLFSYDTVYSYSTVFLNLLRLTHPEDRGEILRFEDYTQLRNVKEQKISFEYRRLPIDHNSNTPAKWTRSSVSLVRFEDGVPTEAFYTVQDIDTQRRRELEAQRLRESLTTQFYTLIRNRFLWFVDNDYAASVSRCYRISDRKVNPLEDIPFGQFFERFIMPICHPEDFKTVAKALLPTTAELAYRGGTDTIALDFRHRSGDSWKYVHAEMYFQTDESDHLHSMLYISDVDQERQQADRLSKSEHLELIMRQKFGLSIEENYVRIGEADLDADCLRHYQINGKECRLVQDETPFSRLCAEFEAQIHPEHRPDFRKHFTYQALLLEQRKNSDKIQRLYRIDLEKNGSYRWCNLVVRFFHDENGKSFLMTYIEDVDDEIRRRDGQLLMLEESRQELLALIRERDQQRVLRAHMFINSASSHQLTLNRMYAQLERLAGKIGSDQPEIRELQTAYEQISQMTKTTKDILLLENNMLPLLQEPVKLPRMLQQMKENSAAVFYGKKLRTVAFTNHVTEETVRSDGRRLTELMETLFVSVIRSLPDGAALTLQLSQHPDATHANSAIYEFSLITTDSSSADKIQELLSDPYSQAGDSLRSIQDALTDGQSITQQTLYFSKRLIEMLRGELKCIRLPEGATAVILRLPLEYIPSAIVFPHVHWYQKRAFVWDSHQRSAMATMEMLRETGMCIEWQANYENLCSNLRAAAAEQNPCALILVRQSELNADRRPCLAELHALAPEIPVLILKNQPPEPHAVPDASMTNVRYMASPLFRSELAERLWDAVKEQEAEREY